MVHYLCFSIIFLNNPSINTLKKMGHDIQINEYLWWHLNRVSVTGNETRKIILGCEIVIDYTISDRIAELVLINVYYQVDFAVPEDHWVKIKRKYKQILRSCQRAETLWNIEDDNHRRIPWSSPKEPRKETKGTGEARKRLDNIGENIVRIPGKLRRLGVTRISMSNWNKIFRSDFKKKNQWLLLDLRMFFFPSNFIIATFILYRGHTAKLYPQKF